MSFKPALIVIMSWLLPLASATAQAVPPPAPLRAGDRVRVRANEEYFGTLLKADSSQLLLQLPDAPDTIAVPVTEIRQLAVFGGRHSGAGHGAKIGAIVGGLLGLAAGVGDQCSVSEGFLCGGPEVIPPMVSASSAWFPEPSLARRVIGTAGIRSRTTVCRSGLRELLAVRHSVLGWQSGSEGGARSKQRPGSLPGAVFSLSSLSDCLWDRWDCRTSRTAHRCRGADARAGIALLVREYAGRSHREPCRHVLWQRAEG